MPEQEVRYIPWKGDSSSQHEKSELIALFDTPEKIADGLPVLMDVLHTVYKEKEPLHVSARIFYHPETSHFTLRYKRRSMYNQIFESEWIRSEAYADGVYIHYGMFSKGRFCSDWCFPPE